MADRSMRTGIFPSARQQIEPVAENFPAAETSADEREILAALNARQLIQTLGMELRNRVVLTLKRGLPGEMTPLRGGTDREAVIRAAIKLEKGPGENHAVLSALYGILHNATTKPHEQMTTQQRAMAILDRLNRGGSPRVPDPDMDDELADALLGCVKAYPGLVDIVQHMIGTRQELKRQLDQDNKFPSLLSHLAFHKRLDADLQRVGLMIFADVIKFKLVNDKYGQSFVDDVVLRPIADAFAANLAKQSGFKTLLCRQGGDEFIAFLEGAMFQERAAIAFATVFKNGLRDSITEESILRHSALLAPSAEERERIAADGSQAATARRILQDLHTMEVRIGVGPRSEGMAGKQAESLANAVVTRTKGMSEEDKKLIHFPTALSTDPEGVYDIFTGNRVVTKPKVVAEGEREA